MVSVFLRTVPDEPNLNDPWGAAEVQSIHQHQHQLFRPGGGECTRNVILRGWSHIKSGPIQSQGWRALQVLAIADWDKYCLKDWDAAAKAETKESAIKTLNEGAVNVPCVTHRSVMRSCIPTAAVPCSRAEAMPAGLLDCPFGQTCELEDVTLNSTFVDMKVCARESRCASPCVRDVPNVDEPRRPAATAAAAARVSSLRVGKAPTGSGTFTGINSAARRVTQIVSNKSQTPPKVCDYYIVVRPYPHILK